MNLLHSKTSEKTKVTFAAGLTTAQFSQEGKYTVLFKCPYLATSEVLIWVGSPLLAQEPICGYFSVVDPVGGMGGGDDSLMKRPGMVVISFWIIDQGFCSPIEYSIWCTRKTYNEQNHSYFRFQDRLSLFRIDFLLTFAERRLVIDCDSILF